VTTVIPEIQALRFIAAGMVLFGHLQHERLIVSASIGVPAKPFEPLFWGAGVDIFFIISGFVMTYGAKDRFGRPGAARVFMLQRLLRVAPFYWAWTTAMLLATTIWPERIDHPQFSWSQVAGSFLFLPVADPYGSYYPLLRLGWTLNFEMLFYSLFAIGLLFRRRAGLASIAVALLLLGGLPYLATPKNSLLAFWAHPILLEFLLGMASAQLQLGGVRLGSATAWSLAAAGIVLLIAVRAAGLSEVSGLTRPLLVGLPALLICAPALVAPGGPAPGPLMRMLMFGGDMSFALYLSHPFSIALAAMVLPSLGLGNAWVAVASVGISALAAGALAYLCFERPVSIWLAAALDRASAPLTTEAGLGQQRGRG